MGKPSNPKPNGVSVRAWEFSCEYQPDDILPPKALAISRTTLARAFDAATAELRQVADAYAAQHGAIKMDWDTLAAYTPEEA